MPPRKGLTVKMTWNERSFLLKCRYVVAKAFMWTIATTAILALWGSLSAMLFFGISLCCPTLDHAHTFYLSAALVPMISIVASCAVLEDEF